MSWITLVLIVLFVAADAYLWFDRSQVEEIVRREILPEGVPFVLTPGVIATGLAIAQVPALLIVWGLWNAFRLFRGFLSGTIFTIDAGRRLKQMGIALAALPFADVAANAAISGLVTMNNPTGTQVVAATIQDSELILAVAGGMLVVIGWVMAEAARLAEENRHFV